MRPLCRGGAMSLEDKLEGQQQAEGETEKNFTPTPMSEEQILANLAEGFLADWQRFKTHMLHPDETVFYVANYSWASYSMTYGDFRGHHQGLIIITDHRQVDIDYQRTKGGFFEKKKVRNPKEPIDTTRLKGPTILEGELGGKYVVPGQPTRYFELSSGEKVIALLGSGGEGGQGYKNFFPEDAYAIHRLILTAKRNGGRIPVGNQGFPNDANSNGQESIPKLIEALAELHQKGIITDEEFQEKKADLLSRL